MKKIFACVIGVGFVAFLSAQPRQFREVQHNIALSASICADDELIINTDGWQLTAANFIEKGYIPVRVKLKNMSRQTISISEISTQHPRPDIRDLYELFKHHEIAKTLLRWIIRSIPCMAIAIPAMLYSIQTGQMEPKDPGVKIFLLCWAYHAINTVVIAPYAYITFRSLNKQLGSDLRRALLTGSIVAKPGQSIEKIFLVPQDMRRSFKLQVFHEYTDITVATFVVDIF